jgi:hypothetical protein
MCGSPTDAFWSQAAIFRCSLDSLGVDYQSARLVLSLGSASGVACVPARWRSWFSRIEVHCAPAEAFASLGDGAQGHELYRLVDPSADISIICDADSLLIRPLPEDFLQAFARDPAICGVIAHYPPPLTPYPGTPAPDATNTVELWQLLARRILGRPIEAKTPYSLPSGTATCPSFYINHAFLAGPPEMLKELHSQQEDVRPLVRAVLDNDFYDQIAIAFAVERGGLPHRALSMRYNFPNDPVADQLYPEELKNIILLHYLRTNAFDRHCIFANEDDFERFMSASLTGSNEVFQAYIARLTCRSYLFSYNPRGTQR